MFSSSVSSTSDSRVEGASALKMHGHDWKSATADKDGRFSDQSNDDGSGLITSRERRVDDQDGTKENQQTSVTDWSSSSGGNIIEFGSDQGNSYVPLDSAYSTYSTSFQKKSFDTSHTSSTKRTVMSGSDFDVSIGISPEQARAAAEGGEEVDINEYFSGANKSQLRSVLRLDEDTGVSFARGL